MAYSFSVPTSNSIGGEVAELISCLIGAFFLSSPLWGPCLILSWYQEQKAQKKRKPNGEPQNLKLFLVLPIVALLGFAALALGIVSGPYAASSISGGTGSTTRSNKPTQSLDVYQGRNTNIQENELEPKGSDIAVRASYNADGSLRRRAHIRSYPDGVKSNNYDENPGMFESVYGPRSTTLTAKSDDSYSPSQPLDTFRHMNGNTKAAALGKPGESSDGLGTTLALGSPKKKKSSLYSTKTSQDPGVLQSDQRDLDTQEDPFGGAPVRAKVKPLRYWAVGVGGRTHQFYGSVAYSGKQHVNLVDETGRKQLSIYLSELSPLDRKHALARWPLWTSAVGSQIRAVVVKHDTNQVLLLTQEGKKLTLRPGDFSQKDKQVLSASLRTL